MSAPSPSPARVSLFGRFWAWLPDHVDRRVRVAAWLSFLAEVLIIGTGGAVRLTGSGLGCPTWPTCTAESIVNTPEMGIHGFIEFGNRTLTGLVGILAIIVLVFVLKMRRERRDLFVLALVVVLPSPSGRMRMLALVVVRPSPLLALVVRPSPLEGHSA